MNAQLATKSKFRILPTVGDVREDGKFRFDVFAIGATDHPFVTVTVTAPNYKRARRLADMKVQARMPGGRPYIGGCAPCA